MVWLAAATSARRPHITAVEFDLRDVSDTKRVSVPVLRRPGAECMAARSAPSFTRTDATHYGKRPSRLPKDISSMLRNRDKLPVWETSMVGGTTPKRRWER